MTDEQKYSAVLKELGEVLKDKNTTISCQKWQIDQLKEKLAAAEDEKRRATATEVRRDDDGMYLVLNPNAISALRGINAELRKVYGSIANEIHCPEILEELQGALKFVLPIAEEHHNANNKQ